MQALRLNHARFCIALASVLPLAIVVHAPAATAAPLTPKLRFPLDDVTGEHLLKEMLLHVDHDPVDHGGSGSVCLAFDGKQNFPNCYDGHGGTDYVLLGLTNAMDAELVQIVAAADGVVELVEDGNYDRCHGDLGSNRVDCDGHPMKSNHVRILHEGGLYTEYHHMKNGSIVVDPGQSVICGDILGLIGSSGMSALPHLHFQLETLDGTRIDPYGGPESQPESYWLEQNTDHGIPGATCDPSSAYFQPIAEETYPPEQTIADTTAPPGIAEPVIAAEPTIVEEPTTGDSTLVVERVSGAELEELAGGVAELPVGCTTSGTPASAVSAIWLMLLLVLLVRRCEGPRLGHAS